MTDVVGPRAVLFDVLGTLVRDPFHEDMPAFFGMSLEEMIAAKHPSAWLEFESGRLDEEAFLARFFADGRAFDAEAFVATVQAGWRWLPGMATLVTDLAAAGHDLFLFSNYPIWWRRLDERLGLSRLARWAYVSCEHGWRKPAPEAFACALSAAGATAATAFFVDDRPENVAAARRLGIEAVRFVDSEQLRRRLETARLLPPRAADPTAR